MYMRYYPRELKPINRIQYSPFDKGKRHYWGYQKGDYGFYQSQDRQYMKKRNQQMKYMKNSRSYSMDPFQIQKLKSLQQRNNNSDCKNNRKSILKMSNPEDIQLPSISRINKQTQTQLYDSLDKLRQFQSSRINQQEERKRQKALSRSNHRRSATQPNNDEAYTFPQKTRFSPTFVCSITNPLPSYLLSPQNYRSLNYVTVQSQRLIRK